MTSHSSTREFQIRQNRVSIAGTVAELPGPSITTEALLDTLGSSLPLRIQEKIQHLGIKSRHSAVKNYPLFLAGKAGPELIETELELAVRTAKKCLKEHPKPAAQIGMLIAVTSCKSSKAGVGIEILRQLKEFIPSSASVLTLAASSAVGFLQAIEAAGFYLQCNPQKTVLVVSAELATTRFKSLTEYFIHDPFSGVGSQELESGESTVVKKCVEAFSYGDAGVALLLENNPLETHLSFFAHQTGNSIHNNKELLIHGFEAIKHCLTDLQHLPRFPLSSLGDACLYLVDLDQPEFVDRWIADLKIEKSDPRLKICNQVTETHARTPIISIGLMLHSIRTQYQFSGHGLVVASDRCGQAIGALVCFQ